MYYTRGTYIFYNNIDYKQQEKYIHETELGSVHCTDDYCIAVVQYGTDNPTY